MTDDELKAFIGSPFQSLMIRNCKTRMAEFFVRWLSAKPEDLLTIQAQGAAYYRILQEISLDHSDLEKLSAETVDEMEEQRRYSAQALEKHMQASQDRARMASYPTP
jgi:hypothetical protein